MPGLQNASSLLSDLKHEQFRLRRVYKSTALHVFITNRRRKLKRKTLQKQLEHAPLDKDFLEKQDENGDTPLLLAQKVAKKGHENENGSPWSERRS